MNITIQKGRLGKDVELKYLPTGTPVANFSIAVDDTYSTGGEKKKKTYWFDCVYFGKLAEVISKYFHKGSGIIVIGKLTTREWESQGSKKMKFEIVGNSFDFVDGKGKGTASGSGSGESAGEGEYAPEETTDTNDPF